MSKQKKKLAIRLYEALFPPKRQATRTYAAAKVSRLNAGWTTQPSSANRELRESLPQLIARSRQAARDDLHIVNYLRLMRANVIGKGIQLQSNARMARGKLNVPLNQRVEAAWWKWCHAEMCTASGKLDWKGVQDLAVTQCERDGAFLIEMADADNDFGFSLRTWDVTWLDPNFSETRNGNRVVMSVELDNNDKPVAYWLTTPPSEMIFTPSGTRERRRVPAERMIHGLQIFDDESQVHGVPGTAAALLPAKYAYGYNEGVITQARVAANTFAVLKNVTPDGEAQWKGEEDDEGNPQHPFIESSPLSVTPMLPGWEMQQFDPKQPTQHHAEFKEALDMDIAVALGVPYFLLMGNWKAVNFSSSRGGLGEFRERCKGYQSFIEMTLCRRVFNTWLRYAVRSKQLALTPEEFAAVLNPNWQARGFEYIEPTKDIAADVAQLRNRLKTPSQILAARGEDYLDFLDRWESDRSLAATKGLNIDELYSEPKALPPPKGNDNEPPPKKDEDRSYTNGEYAN